MIGGRDLARGIHGSAPRGFTFSTNDRIAPVPGFTPAQYRSLALLYVLASARAGMWLIPAFHANIDRGIPEAHDDPQHFDLAAFDREVGRWAAKLSAKPR